MGNTRVESVGQAACGAANESGGVGRRIHRKLGFRRKRFLRRAAVGIAGTGWVFFGAADMSSVAGSRGGAPGTLLLDTALDEGGLRSSNLADLSTGFAWKPHAEAVVFDRKYRHGPVANDSAAGRFAADVRERLPLFRASFEQAGQRSGVDWRLIAAMGYQESSWDPEAVSPTGVRGIMMLTLDTADELDVDRDDPTESIRGGAAYFEQIREHLPAKIHEPDRTDMALAAYNQGIGHLFDARRLAAQAGGNPNRWQDVRAALPLLTEERWFSQTRHGYARGLEAVRFVSRVRGYYGMLSSISAEGGAPQVEVASAGM